MPHLGTTTDTDHPSDTREHMASVVRQMGGDPDAFDLAPAGRAYAATFSHDTGLVTVVTTGDQFDPDRPAWVIARAGCVNEAMRLLDHGIEFRSAYTPRDAADLAHTIDALPAPANS